MVQEQHCRFYELPLTGIRPHGFLRDFLERQRSGLTGHYQASLYPFDTCMWTGKIPPFYRESDYNGLKQEIPDSELWWPYEQCAYLLDGLLRTGTLLNDRQMVEVFLENLNYLLAHSLPDGRLGTETYNHHSEWPMAVLYKAVSAYLKCHPSERVIEAFHRHFLALPISELATEFRWIANIEGMLDIARLTGDDTLRRRAFDTFELFNQTQKADPFSALDLPAMENMVNPVFHGVTICEEVKIPVLLYLAGGDESLLRASEHCWNQLMSYHRQITDMPCAVEYGFGRDPNQGYETCVISDSLYSLGFFLMAEGRGQYGDQMEKIAYNALPGAVTKDFCALQYLSAPNQVVATPYSNGSSYLRGIAPFRQYRPDHFPSCCPGNVHRAMPNFIARMWMRDADGAPVAALYGDSEASGNYHGTPWRIREKTAYPFGEKIQFVFEQCEAETMPFAFRLPGWCSKARACMNGKDISAQLGKPGTFVCLERKWRPGDELVLEFPMGVRHCHDRQWSWFEAGPLVYSLPVEHTMIKEDPQRRFTPLEMRPKSEWGYAIAPETEATFIKNDAVAPYPLEGAPRLLRVKARQACGSFASLALHRYTPRVPLECALGAEATLTLAPMGTTETRITAFPDGKARIFHPALTACAMRVETGNEFCLSPEAFRQNATPLIADSDEYYDLSSIFKNGDIQEAWLQIRFWSDVAAAATAAVLMSSGGIGYFNGEKVLEIPGLMDAQSMEPLWFDVVLKTKFNYLLLKVKHLTPSSQHSSAWGAMATLFRNA